MVLHDKHRVGPVAGMAKSTLTQHRSKRPKPAFADLLADPNRTQELLRARSPRFGRMEFMEGFDVDARTTAEIPCIFGCPNTGTGRFPVLRLGPRA